MADQKKKLNKKALTGFLLAILSPVLTFALIFAFDLLYRYVHYRAAIVILIVTRALRWCPKAHAVRRQA